MEDLLINLRDYNKIRVVRTPENAYAHWILQDIVEEEGGKLVKGEWYSIGYAIPSEDNLVENITRNAIKILVRYFKFRHWEIMQGEYNLMKETEFKIGFRAPE